MHGVPLGGVKITSRGFVYVTAENAYNPENATPAFSRDGPENATD